MNIVVAIPPMFPQIVARFPDCVRMGAVFTWGDKIYSPTGAGLEPDLIAHEEVHCRQQADDPAAWWKRYLVDQRFVLEQELPAYRRQFQVFCARPRPRSVKQAKLRQLAMDLSGPLYGRPIEFMAALAQIRA